GNNKKADSLLDETQKIIDHIQQRKNEAQAKIYMARMQNASYAGRPQDALQYCDKLKPFVGEDSQILNDMAVVYYENADYQEAEPMYKRALAIDEASLGKDHPNVATDLNNLAALYKATNRFSKAEPLMKRALAIDEVSFGKDHPNVARDLNNLAQLYQATNRLAEAEPLMKRALAIDEAGFGKDHPNVAIRLNNLAMLYQATNRLPEAEPLMKRVVEILIEFTRRTGHPHPHLKDAIENYAGLLMKMGYSKEEVTDRLKRLAPEMFKSN
ncbi:MAG TPA: tetratricopeptide repeat protein, partial [Sedimentisphaerales bacterium]